jgi:SAM-dependent methyltransferase
MNSSEDIDTAAVFTGEFVIPGRTPEDLWLSHFERYRFASEFTANKTVLDVACGTGYGSDYLAAQGAKRVVGGDISPEALAYAARHFRRPTLDFVKLDGGRLPFVESTFDVVLSYETIEHMEDQGQFLRECSRVLRPEGVFVCSTPMRLAWRPPWVPKSLNPFHRRELTAGELRDTLRDQFDDVTLFAQACIRFVDVLARYIAFSSGLILSIAPRTHTLSDRARDYLLSLRPPRSRTWSSGDRSQFAVRPLPKMLPGFPGVIIAKAGRRA